MSTNFRAVFLQNTNLCKDLIEVVMGYVEQNKSYFQESYKNVTSEIKVVPNLTPKNYKIWHKGVQDINNMIESDTDSDSESDNENYNETITRINQTNNIQDLQNIMNDLLADLYD